MRTRIGPRSRRSAICRAASSAPGAVGRATKNASPCVSTSTPPCAAHTSRTTRRCSASASAYRSAPSSRRSFVEPSTSVKRKVTVPVGRSWRIAANDATAGAERSRGGSVSAQPRAPVHPDPLAPVEELSDPDHGEENEADDEHREDYLLPFLGRRLRREHEEPVHRGDS